MTEVINRVVINETDDPLGAATAYGQYASASSIDMKPMLKGGSGNDSLSFSIIANVEPVLIGDSGEVASAGSGSLDNNLDEIVSDATGINTDTSTATATATATAYGQYAYGSNTEITLDTQLLGGAGDDLIEFGITASASVPNGTAEAYSSYAERGASITNTTTIDGGADDDAIVITQGNVKVESGGSVEYDYHISGGTGEDLFKVVLEDVGQTVLDMTIDDFDYAEGDRLFFDFEADDSFEVSWIEADADGEFDDLLFTLTSNGSQNTDTTITLSNVSGIDQSIIDNGYTDLFMTDLEQQARLHSYLPEEIV